MQRIKQLSARLGRVPALAYLVAYLILILLFSLIFYALPDRHFQQAAALPKRPPAETEAFIKRDLRAEIQRMYRMNGGASLVVNGWHLLLDRLDVPFLGTSLPLYFVFQLVLPFNNGSDGNPGTDAVMQATVIVYPDGRYIQGDTVFLPFALQNMSASPVEGIPTAMPLPGMQFNYELREIPMQIGPLPIASAAGQEAMLPLSQGLYDRIVAYSESIQGPPSTDSYARMLYFSAGVATFGAPGDIVPSSALAALLVYVEVVSALLLIGLFVNSLAYELGERLRGTPQTGGKPGRAAAKPEKKRPTKRAAKVSNAKPEKRSAWRNTHA